MTRGRDVTRGRGVAGDHAPVNGAGTTGTNGGGDVGGKLERRYRSLLRWYPAGHRDRYEDEMVGMMLAGARPGQRWPGPGEAANVLLFAVRTRLLGRAAPGLRDTRWSDSVAVAGVLLSMLVFAYRLRPALGGYAWSLRTGERHESLSTLIPPGTWVPAVAALVVTVAVLVGRQVIAVAVAWAAALGGAVTLVRGSRFDTPLSSVSRGWLLVAAIVVAAALSVPGTAGRARAVLGWRRTSLFAAACALLTLSSTVDPLLARVTPDGGGYSIELWPKGGGYLPQIFPGNGYGTGLAPLLLYAVIVAMVITVVTRIAAPVRRRLLAVLSPAVVFFALISLFFQNYQVAGAYFDHPRGLASTTQWAVLVGVPVLTFLVALLLVHRADRIQRLTDLGATAMSQSTGSGEGSSRKRL